MSPLTGLAIVIILSVGVMAVREETALLSEEPELKIDAGACCCRPTIMNNCTEDEVYKQEGSRCCMFLPSSYCTNSRLLSFLNPVFGQGEYSNYKFARFPEKCQNNRAFFQIKDAKTGLWSLLTIDNWSTGSKLRATVDTRLLTEPDDVMDVTMNLKSKGEVVITEKATLAGDFSNPILEVALPVRKMLLVTLEMKILNKGQVKNRLVLRRRVYHKPDEVCGVSVFTEHSDLEASQRECSTIDKKSITIPKDITISDYALGVEYEMVGAPLEGSSTSLVEMGHAAESLSALSENLTASERTHVYGYPCWTTNCKYVEQCLWKKLGWDKDPTNAWGIEVDTSVSPLTKNNTYDAVQWKGIPFEIVSPAPEGIPIGTEGLRNAMTVLTAINKMGAQAPLSAGLHLHVNVLNEKVGAPIVLTLKETMAVYVNWIKHQLIIDELHSPDRVNNEYAKGLHLGWGLDVPRAHSLRNLFKSIHDNIWNDELADKLAKNGGYSRQQACEKLMKNSMFCTGDKRFPHPVHLEMNPEKFFQLNLTPLGKFGTFEFRGGSASTDTERVARWIQFLVGFINTFKNPATVDEFFDESFETDLKQLQDAQDGTTLAEMTSSLGGNVLPDFFDYFSEKRPYEKAPGTGCVQLPSQGTVGIFG